MDQINQNNNINLNPFMFQQNSIIDFSPINMNQFHFQKDSIINRDLNCVHNEVLNEDKTLNVEFKVDTGLSINVICRSNEKISEVIKRYQEKTNDFTENVYLSNGDKLGTSSNLTLAELKILNGHRILVLHRGNLLGKNIEK